MYFIEIPFLMFLLIKQNFEFFYVIISARSSLECMTQCSDLHGQCQSGVFESTNRTCRLFNEPLIELKEGNVKEMVYFMKISSMTGINI